MQVSNPHNVKIYNLSVGKSLPEWLSDRKRRALQKKNVDIRRRIELIQDFDMPGISTTVKVSKDGQYVLATGIYKPRIKCFDVNNLSLKFERCFDSEAVTFEMLSDDYSKFVLLQCDRYVEFHVSHGRHHRLRIPKFGRDMQYHFPTCDLFVVGAAPDIYRINLERGQFMTPYTSTTASAINKCSVNPEHHLIVCGTQEGRVEAWDPRSKNLVGSLDCAFSCISEDKTLEGFPSISALKFKGGLTLGVGTTTGQILLYDIRSNKPFYIKDHMSGFPIRDVEFHQQQDLVYSMDSATVKIWDKNNGKLYTSLEATADYNNLCVVPNTGLMFMANEKTKIQTYFIPSLGPAPRWASFLDSLTEELEESNAENVYDDYKFLTKSELENLGLDHLIGTNLLRAYMHGYFVDIRLYKKAKTVADPFEFDKYRHKKIRETIEKDRVPRVQVNKLPTVNKDLAMKLMTVDNKKKKNNAGNLLEDGRFKALFENPDFEVDKNADEFRLLNPVLSKLDKVKKKEAKVSAEFEPMEEEVEEKNQSSDDFDEDSSDDEHTWTREVKKEHKRIQREHRMKERLERLEEGEEDEYKQPKMFALRPGEEFKGAHSHRRLNKVSLGDRLKAEDSGVKMVGSVGNREMTFSTRNKKKDRFSDIKNKRHQEERKRLVRRPVGGFKTKSMFFKGKNK